MRNRTALKSAVYHDAFSAPNLSSARTGSKSLQTQTDQQSSAPSAPSQTQSETRLSAAGHAFEVVTVRRSERRFTVVSGGKRKLESNRYGHYERQRRSSEDSEHKRQLLDQRSRELLASAFESDIDGEEEDLALSSAQDDLQDRWEAEEDFDAVSQSEGEDHRLGGDCESDDDSEDYSPGGYYLGGYNRAGIKEREPMLSFECEMEEVHKIHLRAGSCYSCGFQDCRCDGTGTDWVPARRTMQCF